MGVKPKALQNRPVLGVNLLYYRNIFAQLSDSRQYSQSGAPLPIPISEYVAYCEFFGIRALTERERFFKMVRAQDTTYVRYTSDKIRADMDTNSKSAVAPN